MHPVTITNFLAGLSLFSSCRAVGEFNMESPLGNLNVGDIAEWNVTGTPPFNFEVHQQYGPVTNASDYSSRKFWENNTVAINTTNTTIRWVIPDRDYGKTWTIHPYVQDSSDNRTWTRWYEENISERSSSGLALKANDLTVIALAVAVVTGYISM